MMCMRCGGGCAGPPVTWTSTRTARPSWGRAPGAAIAAGLALYLRDHDEPLPSLLLLHAPILDDRHTTSSSHAVTDPRTWNRAASQAGWAQYLGHGNALVTPVPPYAAPARASDLSGLPPTFFSLGDLELARDEVLDYAARLARAEVPVELHLYPGATHGFDVTVPTAAVSRASRAAQTDALVRALHGAWRE
jgi:acetyl esterase